jgi:hypothetical protein
MENKENNDEIWFQTINGEIFLHSNPGVYIYRLDEIADILSKKRRFGDHIGCNYTVAEHSIFVSRLHYNKSRYRHNDYPYSIMNSIFALLHDAHEAYYGDIVGPLRATIEKEHPEALKFLSELERTCNHKICMDLIYNNHIKKLNQPQKDIFYNRDNKLIDLCDKTALKIESDSLLSKKPKKWFCDDIEIDNEEERIFKDIQKPEIKHKKYSFIDEFDSLMEEFFKKENDIIKNNSRIKEYFFKGLDQSGENQK